MFLAVFFGFHTIALSLAFFVDPSSSHGAAALGLLEEARHHGTWNAKVANLERGSWDTIIFGDSRTHAAVDPTDAAWADGATYNAAVARTTTRETGELVEVALAHSDPKHVILILSLDHFDHFDAGLPGADAPGPPTRALETQLQLALGWPGIRDSWETIARYSAGIPGKTAPLGMRRPRPAFDTRGAFAAVFRRKADQSGRFSFGDDRWAALERLIAASVADGADVDIAVSPLHASLLDGLALLGRWPDYLEMMRRLARLQDECIARGEPVTVWNFAGFEGPNSEAIPEAGNLAPMRWYFEASHYRPEVARAMALRMRGADDDVPAEFDARFGERVSGANVESLIQRLEGERAAYQRRRPEEVEFFLREARSTGWLPESGEDPGSHQ